MGQYPHRVVITNEVERAGGFNADDEWTPDPSGAVTVYDGPCDCTVETRVVEWALGVPQLSADATLTLPRTVPSLGIRQGMHARVTLSDRARTVLDGTVLKANDVGLVFLRRA